MATRPSSLLVTAANQQLTHDFWLNHRARFDLFVSQAVVEECAAGDPQAAWAREAFLSGIQVLEVTTDAQTLAKALISSVPLPVRASVDAVHIAVAAIGGLDYLLTWNCTHIANPALKLNKFAG